MTTAYITHPRFAEHHMPGHPEHAGRIQAVWKVLAEAGLIDRMKRITPTSIAEKHLLRVHTQAHLDLLKRIADQTRMVLIDADTYASPDSPEIAMIAAGAVAQGIDEILSGRANNALAVVRPPGHHAVSNRAMGFCLLSNVAIGARYAQDVHGIQRVMIVDYDVHHGNGTQDVLYDDPSVLFASTHQHPFYPGTGSAGEIGEGAGKGHTLNIPFSAGNGDKNYARAYEEILWPAARRFKPELLIVSAGFDSHWRDPLAQMRVSLPGYAHLSKELIRIADELCDGKVIFVMEGGYDLTALSYGMRNVAHALLGDDEISDPYGLAPGIEPDITPLLEQLKQIHHLK